MNFIKRLMKIKEEQIVLERQQIVYLIMIKQKLAEIEQRLPKCKNKRFK